MNQLDDGLRVAQAKGELAPVSFHWEGRLVRVLYVASVRTSGVERRYRVRTTQGWYELGLDTRGKRWRMCHSPTWLARTWAAMRQLPRYPLPNRKLRSLNPAAAPAIRPAAILNTKGGGGYAHGYALVRQ